MISVPALTNPYELSFALPFFTPIEALKIKLQGTNVLIPVRIMGRNDRNQAWTPMASTVLYNFNTSGKEQSNSAVELPSAGNGQNFNEIKIEADSKTSGFAAIPEVSVVFAPTQIVFLASGSPPFHLALGLKDAVNAFLPMASLIPAYQSGQENKLPLAKSELNTSIAAATITASKNTGDSPSTRSLILWGVLLLGVALLGLMAWTLIKQSKKSSETTV
jgi:Protein of unknown function (DUF3999)